MTVGMPASTRWPRQPEAIFPLTGLGLWAWWEGPPRPERVDLITGENPVLGPDGCFGYRFDPCPVLGPGEGLLATVPVAVPE